ncbi:MAG TPA: Holliday junction resolvase RuvX [bacterium]|nr:Holliday junction resolvase RuvX [bacterium]
MNETPVPGQGDGANDVPLQQLPLGRIMGIDYGSRRIGVGLSDPTQTIASPLTTLVFHNDGELLNQLRRLVAEHEVVAVVVGWPVNMNGAAGEKANAVEKFVQQIRPFLNLPIYLWDERWTTVSAHRVLMEQGLAPSRNRDRVDAIAGAFILEAFLQRLQLLRTRK